MPLPCSAPTYSQPNRRSLQHLQRGCPLHRRCNVSIPCSEAQQPAHASSRAPHRKHSRANALNGAQVTSRNVQEIRGLAPCHPTTKGLPNCLALAPGILKTSSFASLHLILQGGTHQLCPPQVPLSSAVPGKGQKMPICRAVCLKSTWRTYLAGSAFRFPFR